MRSSLGAVAACSDRLGVGAGGAPPDGRSSAVSWSRSGAPHCPQNLNGAGFSNPHRGQRLASAVPQLPQNFMASGFSNPHFEQRCMLQVYPDYRRQEASEGYGPSRLLGGIESSSKGGRFERVSQGKFRIFLGTLWPRLSGMTKYVRESLSPVQFIRSISLHYPA